MKKQDGMRKKGYITRQQAWDGIRLQRMNGAGHWMKVGFTGRVDDRSLIFNHSILH